MFKRLLSAFLTFLLLCGCASESIPSSAPWERVPSTAAPSESVTTVTPTESVPTAAPPESVATAAPTENAPTAAPPEGVATVTPTENAPTTAPPESLTTVAPPESVPTATPPESEPPQASPEISPSEPVTEPTQEPDPRAGTVEALLSAMTLEEKVGQMFLVRCPEEEAAEKVSEYHLGGYILFGRDFQDADGHWLTRKQFTEKLAIYQAAAGVPLLIGVDEEGGTVVRASRNPNLFAEKRQSPQEVYRRGRLDEMIKDTHLYNSGLLELGVNVNLAPVADVSTNRADFIYERSFGQDGTATARYIEAVVTAAGQVRYEPGDGTVRTIGSVLKHFPGYGDNADTHTGVAIDRRPYERFATEDFLPFRAGILAGAGGVLVSHNVVVSMDPSLPASLSPEVHRILREELGFEGVIMTDDLYMDAVETYAADGSVAVLAVLAGNDLIVTTDFETQIPLVIDAVKSGEISEDMIDRAVRRVLEWKYDLGLLSFVPFS